MNLNIFTWNVSGLMSSCSYLYDILNEHSIDFCGIAEHWLYNRNLSILKSVNSKYNAYGVCDNSLQMPSNRRVGKGGVAIMWNIKYDNYVTPLLIDDDRIVGVQFQYDQNRFMYIFQVYLPCRNHCIQYYRDYVDKLYNLYSYYTESGTVILMGDFNSILLELC